jgi:HD-like signal output (HDOD) protein
MVQRFPEYAGVIDACSSKGTLLYDAEEGYFPCTHPVIGSLMVRNWGLPTMISQAIRCHHYADLYDLPDKTLPGGAVSLIAATHIAERLAAQIDGEVDIEVGDKIFARALEHFGMDDGDLDVTREAIERAFSEP